MKTFIFLLLASVSGWVFSSNHNVSCEQDTTILASDLSIHLNAVELDSLLYWVDLEYSETNEQGQSSWKLVDYGPLEDCNIEDVSIVELDDDLGINVNLAQYVEQSNNRSSISTPLRFTLSYNGVDENGELAWDLLEVSVIEAIEEFIEAVEEVEPVVSSTTTPTGGFSISLNNGQTSGGGFSLTFGNAAVGTAVNSALQSVIASGFTF
jgi:hypothetical protein